MNRVKRYCRPHVSPAPEWPCEDATTALKVCCLSADVYDVRCVINDGTHNEYRDYGPGYIVGRDKFSNPTTACPDMGYNTNLDGYAEFIFDTAQDWFACPKVCNDVRGDDGLYRRQCAVGVKVRWWYECASGLVTFMTTWIFAPGGTPQTFLSYPQVGLVTASADWYLSESITIPYLTESYTEGRSRFSLKLKLTCDAFVPCEVKNACFPDGCPCIIDGTTGNLYRTLYCDVSGTVTAMELGMPPYSGPGWQYTSGADYITIQCQNGGLDPYYVAASISGTTIFGSIPAGGIVCDGNNIVDITVTDGMTTLRFYTL